MGFRTHEQGKVDRCLIFRVRASGPYTFQWGCSSAGRAPALQAGGHRFDPVHLHQAQSAAGKGERQPTGSSQASFDLEMGS